MANLPNRLGQQLGNYRLIGVLGEGGFAEVYLGEHIHLGTQAAIKVLHTQLGSDDVDTFRTEARTIAHLIHPHIVRVLEFGVEGRIPFLVMDYAPNGTLRKLHPKGTLLALATIIPYVKQVAEALQYAHDEKLIHRDIKPENMLVGRRNEIFLSDFGIALVAQSSRYQSAQEMAGTMAYMAPEQIQGKPRPASDQYSLGIVVYEWLTGDRPFHGSFTELVGQHLSVIPPSLHEKISTISPEVDQVVQIALAKDPKQRFASVQAFAIALEQASRPAQSQPPTPPREVTLPSQPLLPTILATLLNPSPGLPITISPPNLPPTLRQTSQSERKQPSLFLPITPPSSQLFPPSSLITPSDPPSQRATETPPAGYPSHMPAFQLTRRPSRRTVIVGLVGLTLVGSGITWFATSRQRIPLGTLLYIYRGHSNAVASVAWSPDGKRIASGSTDGTVQVWNAADGSNAYTYKGHSDVVWSVAWSPDGKHIASGSWDKTVQVWTAADGSNIYTYKGHSSSVESVAWSPEGKHVASGSDDNTVQVWTAADGRNIYTYKGHSSSVYSVAWSPDDKRIASGSNDGTVQVWNATDGSNVYTYKGHNNNRVYSVAWSPDGQCIASGSADKTAQVWNATDGRNVYTYKGHNNWVYSVAWSPDSKRIASGSEDQTVQVWNAADGSSVYTYHRHSDTVESVAWSPDGKRIASGSGDGTTQVWVAS
ncbi:MAG TPA: protein kinase [Ktedonobacteraceae bacterium]|jgi:serine/threonine protein kinase/Tol biopolymer transport system component